jgi:hypothetical protein
MTTTEIKNKENSLAELMAKILKEPLKPLDSLKMISDEILDAKDKISEISDALGASLPETDKINKYLKKIREEDFPALASELQSCILIQAESQSHKVATEFNAHANRNSEDLKAISDEFLEKLAKTNETQNEVNKSITGLRNELHLEIKTVDEAIKLLLNEMQAVKHINEKSALDFSGKLETIQGGILIELKDTSSKLLKIETENLRFAQAIAETVDRNQVALIQTVNQKNAVIMDAISSSQIKLKRLTITTSIFFAFMLTYVGYELLKSFN